MKEPNPLNIYDIRTLKVPPPHFEYCTMPMTYNMTDALGNWIGKNLKGCLLYTSPSPRDATLSRMPSSA